MKGAGRYGDYAVCDPHGAKGPASAVSEDVFVNERGAARLGDRGTYPCSCKSWTATEGSPTVFVNGLPMHLGDQRNTKGRLSDRSPDVFAATEAEPVQAAPAWEDRGVLVASERLSGLGPILLAKDFGDNEGEFINETRHTVYVTFDRENDVNRIHVRALPPGGRGKGDAVILPKGKSGMGRGRVYKIPNSYKIPLTGGRRGHSLFYLRENKQGEIIVVAGNAYSAAMEIGSVGRNMTLKRDQLSMDVAWYKHLMQKDQFVLEVRDPTDRIQLKPIHFDD